jgi:hypothetical protein
MNGGIRSRLMSALPLKADIRGRHRVVHIGPKAHPQDPENEEGRQSKTAFLN